MNNNVKIIGVGGFARCGKDTFVGIAKDILSKNGYNPIRIAFADNLKEETQAMLNLNKFNATVYTDNTDEKALIRPLLVWWGCQRRSESPDGLYWVNIANSKIESYLSRTPDSEVEKTVFFVSDARFPNEATWIQEKRGGIFIHLRRYEYSMSKTIEIGGSSPERQYVFKKYSTAPNEEEAKQDPLIMEMADHRIDWESKGIIASSEKPFSALEDPYLRNIVYTTLNATKFFNGKLIR